MKYDNVLLVTFKGWERDWLVYKAKINYTYLNIKGEITLKLDFIAYHMIKYYHGNAKLTQMIQDRVDQLKREL